MRRLRRTRIHPENMTEEQIEFTQHWQDLGFVGQPLQLDLRDDAPPEAVTVNVRFYGKPIPLLDNQPVEDGGFTLADLPGPLSLLAEQFSDSVNDSGIDWIYHDKDGNQLAAYRWDLTLIHVRLDVDANRDGGVDENNPARGGWSWGSEGAGAILLVNSDREAGNDGSDRNDSRANGQADLEDMTEIRLVVQGPEGVPERHELWLRIDDDQADKIRIFDGTSAFQGVLIDASSPSTRLPLIPGNHTLFAEGLRYPGTDFDGLITVELIVQNRFPLFSDKVVLRVAPWLMHSNLQAPQELFMVEVSNGLNQEILADVRAKTEAAGVTFNAISGTPYREADGGEDWWIQDEIQLGYSQAPHKTMPVVLDSPRDRGLDSFPERELLGPDFGHISRQAAANSLDSFGNLEVSPSVEVDGQPYPLGRILFGGAHPVVGGRRMAKTVRDFLHAQQVQSPVELYTEWLDVGHVDEMVTFVPDASDKGFRCLLASPDAAFRLLEEFRFQHGGSIPWLVGKERYGRSVEVTADQVLDDAQLRAYNGICQENIHWNRAVLKQELGLNEGDILDVPMLFSENDWGFANPYFPNMVNLVVLGKVLIVPKPFGPRMQEDAPCLFEQHLVHHLAQNLQIHFVDTWDTYHLGVGEIHCGTAVRRKPPTTPWWSLKPPGSQDV